MTSEQVGEVSKADDTYSQPGELDGQAVRMDDVEDESEFYDSFEKVVQPPSTRVRSVGTTSVISAAKVLGAK